MCDNIFVFLCFLLSWCVCVCEYVCVCANMCLIWYVCLSDSFHLPQPNYWRVFRYEDYKRDDVDDGMFLIIMTMSIMPWLSDQKIKIFLTSVVGALCWLFWNFCLAMHSDVNPSVITLHYRTEPSQTQLNMLPCLKVVSEHYYKTESLCKI